MSVTGPGSTWTVGGNLPLGVAGTGELTVADGGTPVSVGGGVGQVSISTALSTINIGVGGTAGVLQAGSLVNNGVLSFDHTDEATITAPISGDGQILKFTGAGRTTLANVSAFTGPFSVQGGRVVVLQGNANGSDYAASDGGTLRFAGGTVNLSLGVRPSRNRRPSGIRHRHRSQRVFARSRQHYIESGEGGTSFNAVTTFNSTNILQDGTASLNNFTNGGTLTNNATLTFNGGINASTGVIIVNDLLNTLDVGNSGVVTVNNNGVINNSVGNLVNGGGSRTTINTGGTINLLDGTTLDLNGALLVNNGTVNGTTNVNYGSLAKGTAVTAPSTSLTAVRSRPATVRARPTPVRVCGTTAATIGSRSPTPPARPAPSGTCGPSTAYCKFPPARRRTAALRWTSFHFWRTASRQERRPTSTRCGSTLGRSPTPPAESTVFPPLKSRSTRRASSTRPESAGSRW